MRTTYRQQSAVVQRLLTLLLVCANCTKRKIECGYLKDSQQAKGEPLKTSDGQNSSDLYTQSYPASSYDVQLMYYYSTQTYRTLSDDDSRHFVWQVEVPELAFKHDFLLYGLWAFTAFHRCRLSSLAQDEKTSLIRIGRHYKQHGLGTYIPALEHSSSDNCHALFAFSLLLGSLCLAELQHDFEQANFDTVAFFSALFDITTLLSGCIAIADKHRDVLRRSNLAPLLGSDLQVGDLTNFPTGLREALEKVFYGIQHTPEDMPSADTEACIAALKRLGLVYPANGQPSGTRAALIAWPVLGGRSFMDLMHSRDTLALICLAHYGAIVHDYRGVWFLEGLGERLVSSVLGVVPQSSRKYLDWAARTIGRANEVSPT